MQDSAARCQDLESGIRRILAPNPSPMTFTGTNTYLVGVQEVTVIDPGPADAAHRAAIEAAVGAGRIAGIVVTHAHLDHSALASDLARRHGVAVTAFGPPDAGRRPVMARLAAAGLAGGGEGVDRAFRPDRETGEGDRIATEVGDLEVLHTPGHFAGHLSLALNGALFTGDHVMGWASSMVSPPDGDLTAFMESCKRLRARDDRVYYPGHGDAVHDPAARLDWLIGHRRAREAAILAALDDGAETIAALVDRVYGDAPSGLRTAAARNVFAHLVDLAEKGLVAPIGALDPGSAFRRS
jgi:glyoxylase-like metal-dependent hydrolase (beta-lactamase superfamily II)